MPPNERFMTLLSMLLVLILRKISYQRPANPTSVERVKYYLSPILSLATLVYALEILFIQISVDCYLHAAGPVYITSLSLLTMPPDTAGYSYSRNTVRCVISLLLYRTILYTS